MLRPDGYVKVLDFGLARQIVSQETGTLTATEPGMLVGTLRYMSPEQSRGEAAHPPSDVFSLGLLLFEMATGRHPFHADSTIGVLHGIQSSRPDPRVPAPARSRAPRDASEGPFIAAGCRRCCGAVDRLRHARAGR